MCGFFLHLVVGEVNDFHGSELYEWYKYRVSFNVIIACMSFCFMWSGDVIVAISQCIARCKPSNIYGQDLYWTEVAMGKSLMI